MQSDHGLQPEQIAVIQSSFERICRSFSCWPDEYSSPILRLYAFSITILFSSCRTFTKSPFLIFKLTAYCFGSTMLNDCSPTRPWILRYRFSEQIGFSIFSILLASFILCKNHEVYKQ